MGKSDFADKPERENNITKANSQKVYGAKISEY